MDAYTSSSDESSASSSIPQPENDASTTASSDEEEDGVAVVLTRNERARQTLTVEWKVPECPNRSPAQLDAEITRIKHYIATTPCAIVAPMAIIDRITLTHQWRECNVLHPARCFDPDYVHPAHTFCTTLPPLAGVSRVIQFDSNIPSLVLFTM
jgi:hypothetical protein